jgi:hypothetical protein
MIFLGLLIALAFGWLVIRSPATSWTTHSGTRTSLFVAGMPMNSPMCLPAKSPSHTALPSATMSFFVSALASNAT